MHRCTESIFKCPKHSALEPNLPRERPAAYRAALTLLEKAKELARDANLLLRLVDLVKARVARINGCPYCMRLLCRRAAELEAPERTYVLRAWRKTCHYDEPERATRATAGEATSLRELSSNSAGCGRRPRNSQASGRGSR